MEADFEPGPLVHANALGSNPAGAPLLTDVPAFGKLSSWCPSVGNCGADGLISNSAGDGRAHFPHQPEDARAHSLHHFRDETAHFPHVFPTSAWRCKIAFSTSFNMI